MIRFPSSEFQSRVGPAIVSSSIMVAALRYGTGAFRAKTCALTIPAALTLSDLAHLLLFGPEMAGIRRILRDSACEPPMGRLFTAAANYIRGEDHFGLSQIPPAIDKNNGETGRPVSNVTVHMRVNHAFPRTIGPLATGYGGRDWGDKSCATKAHY